MNISSVSRPPRFRYQVSKSPSPQQSAAQRELEVKRQAELDAKNKEKAREKRFSTHFSEFEKATKAVGKRLPKDGLGSRYIHSKESFVKVTEGLVKGDGDHSLTVVRRNSGGKLSSFDARSLGGELTEQLIYTKYSFSDDPNGKIIEENFKLQPDGTAGFALSRFTIEPSNRTVKGDADGQEATAQNESFWKGVLGTGKAKNKPEVPAASHNLEPMLSRVESLRLGELNRTFEQLSELALKHDGSHLDHDGEKDGKVNLAPLQTYGGILLGEERVARVRQEGIKGSLGFTKEVLNPYTEVSTHGSVEAGEDGQATSMDLTRQRVKLDDAEELPALKPDTAEAHFHQRTEKDGTRVYEVKTQGSVERLIEESNGTLSYFSSLNESPELLNHDLPGFQHKAQDPRTHDEFLNLAYLSHHQEIARLPEQEQPAAWAEKSLNNGIEPDYAIKSIQNYDLHRQQRLALRMAQREADAQESTSAKLAIQKAALIAFRGTDSKDPKLSDLGKTTKALIEASRKEKGTDQKLLLQTGIDKMYTMTWRPNNVDFKLAAPRRPESLESDPHFLGQLLELDR